ncbi:hypothetical protein GYMLUDRAFT_241067 [Collybiopsis luxurians FD-317 M1]|nr:hypothetical protein GYMLUDRAFT_241067 [Collybiopsis luxurians FD-317 M1]
MLHSGKASWSLIESWYPLLLDALRHGCIPMGVDVGLIIFDEAHHAVDNDSYNRIIQRQMRRLMIMNLTTSPIFGGNVDEAFRMIETNSRLSHRIPPPHPLQTRRIHLLPTFKHILYNALSISSPPFSTNLAALEYAAKISNDPNIKSVATNSPKKPSVHLNIALFTTIANEGRSLRDLLRAAREIVIEGSVWSSAKAYLIGIINGITITPMSYYANDIVDDQSDKTFSALVFVQRRDVVLALSHLLSHHPVTTLEFQVGPLLGASDSSHRRAFLDIARRFVKQTQNEILIDFRLGERNLIVSTSVAEEGIDVQACGCGIRWDRPMNMASWAQSRGRARRRSTFVMMFKEGIGRGGEEGCDEVGEAEAEMVGWKWG